MQLRVVCADVGQEMRISSFFLNSDFFPVLPVDLWHQERELPSLTGNPSVDEFGRLLFVIVHVHNSHSYDPSHHLSRRLGSPLWRPAASMTSLIISPATWARCLPCLAMPLPSST